MITYGGISLAQPLPQTLDWIESLLPTSDIAQFYPGLKNERPVKPNSLWWPTDASRWAIGYFFATDNQLAQIRALAFPNLSITLPTASAPTTAVGGGTPAGATSYYFVVGEDANGFRTLVSAASSSAARGSSAANWRKVTWTGIPGAVKYYILVNSSSTAAANTLMALTGTWQSGAITGVSSVTGGSGGTNGTFTDGTFVGGGGTDGTFAYTIAGGTVTNICILNGGGIYDTNPTFTMPSAGALTGFFATANIADVTTNGGNYLEVDDSGQVINETFVLPVSATYTLNRIPLPLVMVDGTNPGITALMYMLPPRPMSQLIPTAPTQVVNNLNLLVLVDQRYFWWEKSANVTVAEGTTTWQALYRDISTALDVPIFHEAVNSKYLFPPASFSFQDNIPLLLDEVAASVGQRVVVALDGTVTTQSPATAIAAQSFVINSGYRQWAGGLILTSATNLNSLVPKSVTVNFPLCDATVWQVDVTLVSLALALYGTAVGFPGSHPINDLAIANGNPPSNSTELTALATQMANDWYLWQLGSQDTNYVGILNLAPSGMADIEWTATAGPMVGEIYEPISTAGVMTQNMVGTRVQRSSWTDFATGHAGSSGSYPCCPAVGGKGTNDFIAVWNGTSCLDTGTAYDDQATFALTKAFAYKNQADGPKLTGSITGATNASPIVINAVGHGLSDQECVRIESVGGNTNANGNWRITRTDADHFSLNGSTGNSGYTSGGTWWEATSAVPFCSFLTLSAVHIIELNLDYSAGLLDPYRNAVQIYCATAITFWGKGSIAGGNLITGALSAGQSASVPSGTFLRAFFDGSSYWMLSPIVAAVFGSGLAGGASGDLTFVPQNTGTDFTIVTGEANPAGTVYFNLPDTSATARGVVKLGDQILGTGIKTAEKFAVEFSAGSTSVTDPVASAPYKRTFQVQARDGSGGGGGSDYSNGISTGIIYLGEDNPTFAPLTSPTTDVIWSDRSAIKFGRTSYGPANPFFLIDMVANYPATTYGFYDLATLAVPFVVVGAGGTTATGKTGTLKVGAKSTAGWITDLGSGGTPGIGSVTSVALALPASVFTISGSPVTTSGTLTGTFATQSAHMVFAGPTSGGAATPDFRALVAADIPSGGGSPLTTKGDVYVFSTVNDRLPVGTNGQILSADSTQTTGLAWVNGLTTKGDLWSYSTAPARLAVGTNGQLLSADSTQATGLKWVTASAFTGSGTTNMLTKWTSSTALGNAGMSDDGTTVSMLEPLLLLPTSSGILPGLRFGIGVTQPSSLQQGDMFASNDLLWYQTSTKSYKLNPLATVGDIQIYDGSTNHGSQALSVGSNGQVLSADSTQTGIGLKWVSPNNVTGSSTNARTTSDVTTTSNSYADVTGLGFTIGASEVWTCEWNLAVTGSTAGMKFQVTGPASPTDVNIQFLGTTGSATQLTTDWVTAFSTPSAGTYSPGSTSGIVRITACFNNGANSGTVQLQFAAATNTQTNKVMKDSYLTARKIS